MIHPVAPECCFCGFSGQAPVTTAFQTSHSPHIRSPFQSNEIPSDSEVFQIQDLIAAEKSAIVELDQRMEEIRKPLSLLPAEHAQKERTIASYQQILHPLRRISEDILREIFLSCDEEEPLHQYTSPIIPLDTRTLPWTSSQVYSLWRAFARAYPRLCSTICVCYRETRELQEAYIHKDIAVLSTHPSRASLLELDIAIASD
ncbi:hypothetical protein C8J56DRAFT_1060788 [Mycena floridula]|nr:hypothetical protein C8J56DRAFT_1060788 [Mycena floridula]